MANKRSETLNMRIDPKLKYLAGMAALETERTLSNFIERAIKRALTPAAMMEDEATPGTELKQPLPLYNEGFWDVEKSDRFFKLALFRHNLLSIEGQRFWKFFNMHIEHTGEQPTLTSFREFWNDPAIDTSHLKDGE